MVVWNESNEIELSSDGDDTLKKFLHYRRNSLLSYPNDNAQLLTKEQFEGGVVGKCIIYWVIFVYLRLPGTKIMPMYRITTNMRFKRIILDLKHQHW